MESERLMILCFTYKELLASEVNEDLIEKGHSEEILQKTCPAEYSGLKEEEVSKNTSSEVFGNVCEHITEVYCLICADDRIHFKLSCGDCWLITATKYCLKES